MNCATCSHFDARAAAIEQTFPGLSSLSSGYAAVRAADGLCEKHERYVAPSSTCRLHTSSGAVSHAE
jgi:hypothetical protein